MFQKAKISLLYIALLSGCVPAVDSAKTLATDLKDNVYTTTAKVKDWAMTPPVVPQPHEITNSYCYYVLQDILCYHQPMPGLESRLVAYQGTHAQPPAPYTMELLPKREAAAGNTPPDYAANAKPVFSTPPAAPKNAAKPSDPTSPPAVADPTREVLPDPATSPQL